MTSPQTFRPAPHVPNTAGVSASPLQTARLRERRPSAGLPARKSTRYFIYIGVVVLVLACWEVASLFTSKLFLPGPVDVARSGAELIRTGELWQDAAASWYRIGVGWAIGAAIAIPTGLAAGRVWFLRLALDPIINFFRFIPPIALITLTIVWFGLGEASKISLIIYTSGFLVFLNTAAGAQRIDKEKLRAGASLGASRRQLVRTVIIPATVPDIMTGMRLAMGNAFMTVVAAELVAAQSGIGFMIYNSRVFGETSIAFVGIFTLGVMGLLTDALLRLLFRPVAYRYDIKF